MPHRCWTRLSTRRSPASSVRAAALDRRHHVTRPRRPLPRRRAAGTRRGPSGRRRAPSSGKPADHQLLLRQQPPRARAASGTVASRGPVAGSEVLRQRERDERRDVRMVEGRVRGQRSCDRRERRRPPPRRCRPRASARGSTGGRSTRADASTSASTGARRASVAGVRRQRHAGDAAARPTRHPRTSPC